MINRWWLYLNDQLQGVNTANSEWVSPRAVDVSDPAVKAVNSKCVHAQSQYYCEGMLERGNRSHKIVQILSPGEKVVLKALNMHHG